MKHFCSIPNTDNYEIEAKEYEKEINYLNNVAEEKAKRRQFMIGKVVSTKCAKSVTVAVNRYTYIPKYNTYRRKTKKFMAHDENEVANMGDIVRIVQCRPMSRKKRHTVMDIIKAEPQLSFDLKDIENMKANTN
jgi:small subunit ribosomal protein S17